MRSSTACWKERSSREHATDSSRANLRPCLNVTTERKMKLSARNLLKGTIVEVKKGQTTALVRIDVAGTVVTASITNEAVDELKLQKGQQAYAVIKASDVMVGID